jgi:hypothetical protein
LIVTLRHALGCTLLQPEGILAEYL